ncbi:MtrB/PioB family decaheme-associated outer membrane protein [Shewanella sp. SNU WT4]|uniref:MtrB/PioB family decaheme-associated outer membrane protein n=1 Tax=Shewanella sp. SNU WT4 TaxID=2590015 RepID=UPI00112C0320|nr:MtrB/PioB family decaheme-associated outer membrane protein [Shewanella sp. SNU WT4]QDF66654.1 MtrB/PioB family decaheme-associated outer membrane protein [Shewanella sp. SNU WT4]
MNFKLNLITLALVASSSMAMADGYNLNKANTVKVKYDAWQCKACTQDTGVNGTVAVGVGYIDSNDNYSGNNFGSDNQVPAKVDANLVTTGINGHRATVNAYQLGMDNGFIDVNAGSPGDFNINARYQNITTWKNDNALTPYQGIGGNDLTLPSNWVTAGNTAGMTQLNSSLNAIDLTLKRDRYGLGLVYQADSLWSSFIDYEREHKTGLKTASGSFFNQSMMLAEPVDYTTDTLAAGVNLAGDSWFSQLSYQGSMFSNNYAQLNFDNAFNPTFGAQTQGAMALDPDNQAHTVALTGQWRHSDTIVNGRLYLGQMSQDQALVTSGYGYQLPTEAVDAKVDLTGATVKVVQKLSSQVRMQASYDYYDRDNQTDVDAWTQISINDVNGKVSYNTPYDYTNQQLKLALDYRISRGMKLDGGYDFKRQERDYEDRETTDESTLWTRFSLSSFEQWNFSVKGSFGLHEGSRYQASTLTSSENNALLRKFNLADRKRSQIQAQASYAPTDSLSFDLSARYALDDYDHTQIGLTETQDYSTDIGANYLITDDISVNAFYGYQQINSKQNGSSNFNAPTWSSQIDDTFHFAGAGIAYNNLMADKLALGLDYSYSDSQGDTQVTQGVTGNYGDFFAKSHNVNLYATYQVSQQASVRMDYMYERYQDNDPANSLSTDAIWNVLSFGNLNHDYNAHMVMLSLQYKL